MSKRSRKRKGYDKQKRQEIMHSQVTPGNAADEDAIVQDFFSKLPSASEEEAMKMAIALKQHITGEEVDGEKKSKLIGRAKRRDKAHSDFVRNKQEFLENAYDEGKKRASTVDEDEAWKRGLHMLQEARQNARAKKATKHLQLMEKIKNGPTETLYVIPQYETRIEGQGRKVQVPIPEVIGVSGFKFVLQPGPNKNVPSFVCELYRERLEARSKNSAFESKFNTASNDKLMNYDELRKELRNQNVEGESAEDIIYTYGDF